MKNLGLIFLILFALIFGVTEVVADTDKDDPIIQAFWKLMFEPSVENLHAARNSLFQSPGFSPYSEDIYAMMALSNTSGDPNKIIEIYFNSLPNLILSPSAHRMVGEAFAAIGEEKHADFEKKVTYVLLKSLLSSGEGSKVKPYAVMRTTDEHDVLDAMGKKISKKDFVIDHENNRALDVVTCLDGSQVYFDVSRLSAEPYQHSETNIRFPDRLAGLQKISLRNYEKEQPGLGISVGYGALSGTATIYLYTLGMESIPNNIESPILRKHFEQVTEEIILAGENGLYRNVKKLSEEDVFLTAAGTGLKAISATFTYTIVASNKDTISKLYLMVYKNHFMKVRFTYHKDIQPEGEKTLKQLLEMLSVMIK